MCYHGDARPPLAPVRAGVAAGGDMVLRSTDGSYFSAHFAHPDIPSATGVVILPDIRGLHDFYRDLAHRFAEAGHHAVVIDYFGRSAGTTARADDFAFRDHVAQMELANVDRDVAAAVAWLGGTATAAFTVGFCLGGALSWRQSAANPGLAGCVGFYGKPERARDAIPGMRAPVLLLAAGQDHTPVAEVEAFAAERFGPPGPRRNSTSTATLPTASSTAASTTTRTSAPTRGSASSSSSSSGGAER